MLSQPAATALNHLLTQSGWALQRLARFAGKTARFNIAPFSFACTIQDDGTLRAAAQDASVDASFTIPPSLLPRLALHRASARNSLSAEVDGKLSDEAAFAQIVSSGDATLLEEIFYLGRNLRWDVAEDLSIFTGDIIAERTVQFAKASRQQMDAAMLNLSQALAEYWTEERPLLAKRTQIASFVQQVDILRNDVERLEQRINRLTHS